MGKFLSIEALAIMLSKDNPEFKQIVGEEMRCLIDAHEAHTICERGFDRPIPPKNRVLGVPMNYLLKDFWKFPADWVLN